MKSYNEIAKELSMILQEYDSDYSVEEYITDRGDVEGVDVSSNSTTGNINHPEVICEYAEKNNIAVICKYRKEINKVVMFLFS